MPLGHSAQESEPATEDKYVLDSVCDSLCEVPRLARPIEHKGGRKEGEQFEIGV